MLFHRLQGQGMYQRLPKSKQEVVESVEVTMTKDASNPIVILEFSKWL
jgi:hypothetical protein